MSHSPTNSEIDVRELFLLILKKSWIIIICIIIAASATGYYSYMKLSDYYFAEATIYLGKEGAEETIDLGTISLNNQLMSDYMSLINSRLVADEVVSRLGLDIPPETIQYGIEASSTSMTMAPTRMFVISYQYSDPLLAANIVNTTCEVVIEKAEEIIGVNNARIIDKALVPQAPIGPARKKNIAIAAAVGFALGILIILMIEFFDRTFRKSSDIEKSLDLTVLGTIPLFKGEKRD